MNLRSVMMVTALVGLVGVLIVEAFALTNEKEGDTLSEIVADGADISRAIPFALAVVVGHFVSRREIMVSTKTRLFMGLSLIPGALLSHFLVGPAWLTAAVGLVAGWALWPLSK